MTLNPVNSIPGRKPYSKLTVMLDEFMAMDANIVEIDTKKEGYKNAYAMCGSLWKAIQRSGYGIKHYIRGDKVYLKKI